jgi:alpha-galactosidase
MKDRPVSYNRLPLLVYLLVPVFLCNCTTALSPGSDTEDTISISISETEEAENWAAVKFEGAVPDSKQSRIITGDPPFSFVYDGTPSAQLLAQWPVTREQSTLDANRTQHTVVWNDPATRLEVKLIAVAYSDFPTVEWTVWFTNRGSANTPILSGIKGIDTSWENFSAGSAVLHYNSGSRTVKTDFMPQEKKLLPGGSKQFAAMGGVPSRSELPYFNVEGKGGGVIAVVGWSGQWAGEFVNNSNTATQTDLFIAAGQELTRFVLYPGEEARSSMTVLQFYTGDRERGQNIWRQWFLKYNVPKFDGEIPKAFLAALNLGAHNMGQDPNYNAAAQKYFIDRYFEEGIPLDYWWIDAAWYPFDYNNGWWQVGTWEPDPVRFPNGLEEVGDYAHDNGLGFILWVEPEHVYPGTWLAENHREWILENPASPFGGSAGGILNMGNPDTWNWVVEKIDGIITTAGVDVYRQDFNVVDAVDCWRNNDTADRQGMTEMKYLAGYLGYWDELKRRHPNLLIDACAGGGRRDDIETLRRSVPLWRSDEAYSATAFQGETYGLASWIPLYGTGGSIDLYNLRSALMYFYVFDRDMRITDQDFSPLITYAENHEEVSEYFTGDYYPLTEYSLSSMVWMAFQFGLTDGSEGMVQAFRRENAEESSARFYLKGLNPNAVFSIRDIDGDRTYPLYTGRALMEEGILIEADEKPEAVILLYKKEE